MRQARVSRQVVRCALCAVVTRREMVLLGRGGREGTDDVQCPCFCVFLRVLATTTFNSFQRLPTASNRYFGGSLVRLSATAWQPDSSTSPSRVLYAISMPRQESQSSRLCSSIRMHAVHCDQAVIVMLPTSEAVLVQLASTSPASITADWSARSGMPSGLPLQAGIWDREELRAHGCKLL